MSSPTSTPAALRSEAAPWRGTAWRLVEAQHVVSTLKLVDTLAEQETLEALLETSKPPMPEACRPLHYLYATPFRYRPYPAGSRFRRAGLTPGVWYGAEAVATSVAEMAFYRLLFQAEAPGLPWPANPAAYTAFDALLATDLALDLTGPGLRGRGNWRHPTDHAACQALAEQARDIGCGIIRYASVRDPAGGAALAVLDCAVFARPEPTTRQSWTLHLSARGAIALCEHPRRSLEFPLETFAADPRLAPLRGG